MPEDEDEYDCDKNKKINNELLKNLFVESGFSKEEIENLGL